MNDTPRTDAAKIECGFQAVPDAFLKFAQQLERENASLREMIDLAFRIPEMTDSELAELIRNCSAVRKEQS